MGDTTRGNGNPKRDEIWRPGMTRHGANYIMPFSPAISSLIKTPSMHGTDEEKNQLLAETYFMRAQAYFELINLYGEPYESAEQAEKASGSRSTRKSRSWITSIPEKL